MTEAPSDSAADIADLPRIYYAVAFCTLVLAVFTNSLPTFLVGGFALTMILGGLLVWLGNLVPVLRDFGLPTVLCIFVPATVAYFGAMPQSVINTVSEFTQSVGFLDFVVVAVVTGSILGMPRILLVKAGPSFLVPLVGCILLALLGTSLLGALVGYGFSEALFFVAAPTMGGGIALGAIPMSEIYATEFGGGAESYLPRLMSAVVLANVFCILIAGVYNGVGRRGQLFVGFNGEGQLLRFRSNEAFDVAPRRKLASYVALGQGLLIGAILFVMGNVLNAFVSGVHAYAWVVLLAAVVKIAGLLPSHLEDATSSWGDLVTRVWVPALLVGVSLSYIQIGEVLDAFADPLFGLLTLICVLLSSGTAGFIGWLVRMNFVEASLTPGLAMADSGSSGDIAMLSAAGRMNLMPFAQLSTRLGGMVTLMLISLLVPLLSIGG